MPIPRYQPTAVLHINNKDRTGFFEPFLLEATFVHHLKGKADAVEIRLEDTAGRWLDEWYPVAGANLQLWLGYEGGALLDSLVCQVDEIEIQGAPSVVTVRAQSTPYTKGMRTPKSKGFEGASLRAIAQTVASTYGLTLVGDVPDITWQRATQYRETDLGFLCRLGEENGLVFTVKGDSLVFYDLETLQDRDIVKIITVKDLTSYHFRETMPKGQVVASYMDPDTKQLNSAAKATGFPSKDQVKVRRRTENGTQAQRFAHAALRRQKDWHRGATLNLPGDPSLLAGANIELTGFGVMDGLWLIESARHSLSREAGYTTELEATLYTE